MGAQPKRRTSSHRKGRRRAVISVKTKNLVKCEACGAQRQPHVACPSCGAYKQS